MKRGVKGFVIFGITLFIFVFCFQIVNSWWDYYSPNGNPCGDAEGENYNWATCCSFWNQFPDGQLEEIGSCDGRDENVKPCMWISGEDNFCVPDCSLGDLGKIYDYDSDACVYAETQCATDNECSAGVCINGACVILGSGGTYLFCGDGVLSTNLLEECDDGNNVYGDGCSGICLIEVAPSCGDGIIQSEEEECDGSNLNGYTTCKSWNRIYLDGDLSCYPSTSIHNCTFDLSDCEVREASCGDGILNGIEECETNWLNCEGNCKCKANFPIANSNEKKCMSETGYFTDGSCNYTYSTTGTCDSGASSIKISYILVSGPAGCENKPITTLICPAKINIFNLYNFLIALVLVAVVYAFIVLRKKKKTATREKKTATRKKRR